RRARRATVDPGRASLAELPLENERRATRLEHALHHCPLGAVPYLVRAAPGPEGEAERVDDERLAAARFAGEQVEAGSETHPRLGDQSEVAGLELPQQRSITSWAPVGVPNLAFRPAAGRSSRAG